MDEYNLEGSSLRDAVNDSLFAAKRNTRVRERSYANSDRVRQINELAELLIDKDLTLEELAKMPDLPAVLAGWVARLRQRGVDFNFNRFARYLRHGTLLKVGGFKVHAQHGQ